MKLVITGPKGIGKTTIVRKVIKNLRGRWLAPHNDSTINGKVGGFYTQPFIEDGIRKGFEICDFTRYCHSELVSESHTSVIDGHKKLFAHIDFKTPYRIGQYGVDLTVFDKTGVAMLRRARKNASLIVMDELGILEQGGNPDSSGAEKFLDEALRCFQSKKHILAVIQKRAFPYWNERIKDFPDIETYEVTPTNRDTLPSILLSKINITGTRSVLV